MKLRQIWLAIFDFLVGDWALLVGTALTLGVIILIAVWPVLVSLRPMLGLLLVGGVLATLTVAVWRKRPK